MFLAPGTLPDLRDDMPEYRQPLSTPGEERGRGDRGCTIVICAQETDIKIAV